MVNKNRIRVGVLLDGSVVQEWELRALQRLVDEIDAVIDVVVINQEAEHQSLLDTARSLLLDITAWKSYVATRRMIWQFFGKPAYRRKHSIDSLDLFKNANCFGCTPQASEPYGNELPDQVVDQLKDIDIAVRFGFGILLGDTLTAPKHGVLSYHHGDLRQHRGPPVGFWELYQNQKSAGVTVQRLNETIDGGEIMAFERIDITDLKSLPSVQQRLFRVSEQLLIDAVRRAIRESPLESPDDLGILHTNPAAGDLARYFFQRLKWTVTDSRVSPKS